jgi:ligand-binding sensor domain-containing protein
MKLPLFSYFLLLILLLSNHCSSQLQQPKFNLVKGIGEVSLGGINGITQDPDGYLWFADQMKSCIIRYDGYKMTSFKNDSSNPNSLGGTYPETILADKDSNIWIGFYGMGLDRYNRKTGKFTHFRYDKNDPSSLANDSVTTILIGKDGTLWIGNYGGLDRFEPKTGKFHHYTYNENDPNSLSSNRVRSLYEDRQGIIWVGTGLVWDFNNDGGLNRFDKKTGKFIRYLHDPKNPHSLINNKVSAIFEDSKGKFWVGTAGDGLHTMNPSTGLFTRHTYDPDHPQQLSRAPVKQNSDDDHITFITEDITGTIWIGTYHAGVSLYDPLSGKTANYNSLDKKIGLTDNSCWRIYASTDGVLWMSTNECNLYRIDPLRKNIPYIETGSMVQAFYQDASGALWLGSPRGLTLVNKNHKISNHFTPGSLHQSSEEGATYTILEKPGTNFWLTFGGKLLLFDPKKRTLSVYADKFPTGSHPLDKFIKTIFEDGRDSLWVGTYTGLYLLNQQTGSMKRWNLSDNGLDYVQSIIEDRTGDLWVATRSSGSIYRWNRGTGKMKRYTAGDFCCINCMYKDSQGDIWVGTSNGLYHLKTNTEIFSLYNVPGSPLGSADIRSIIEDDKNNIWVGTKFEIFRINQKTSDIANFGKDRGITTNGLSLAVYKLTGGELLFGDATGYYAFLPDQLIKNKFAPKIVITDFKISNHLVDSGGNILSTPSIRIKLQHNQNTFSFGFAGIHYSNPEENTHMFMLEGHETTWRIAGPDRSAQYFNLPPGRYVFKVRAASSDKIWSEASVTIIISPAWWNTGWFRITASLFMIALLYGLVRWRLHQKFRRQLEHSEKEKQVLELQQQKTELEMQALRSQMNPHFIFNSLNSINRFILQNNKVQASEYLTKFSRLVRMILQNSQAALITLESELEALQLYLDLESLRFNYPFDYKVNVKNDLETFALKVPPLIIQPYVENAIWHGLMHKETKGQLDIDISQENEEWLYFRIADNGIGRQRAAILASKSATIHKPMGLGITAQRIAMVQNDNGGQSNVAISDLVAPDSTVTGTEVIIKIPIIYD